MTEQEKINWLRLARTETIGPITFHRLMARYKTATKVLDILPTLSKNKPIKIYSMVDAEAEINALQKIGGRMIYAGDKDYPVMLSSQEDAPPVLSIIGSSDLFQKQSVAIVGSRNASINGRKLAHKMARDLGEKNITITSGLARGIDTSAHEGSLTTGTIAVVAGGVDVVYPRENTELYQKICEGGAVISECALGTQPIARHFPKRNRIVAGLSVGTVVIEANLKSGSLITARMAAEMGRDVMAAPGFPLDPRSEGTNSLIRDGATLVRNAEDVMEQIDSFLTKNTKKYAPPEQSDMGFFEDIGNDNYDSGKLQDIIFPQLSHSPVSVDEIIRLCHVSIAEAQGVLLEMELDGTIQRLPGNRVCLLG